MPVVKMTNPGVDRSITRPIVLEVVRQVLEWTGLKNNTPIQYPGETGTVQQPGSNIASDPDFNRFDSNTTWRITVDENYQTDQVLTTAVEYDDNPAYFSDPDTGVYIRPVYSPTDISINIISRHTDKDAAIRWRDDIRMRISTLRAERVHIASYSYIIPFEFIIILREIHKMREAVAPYGETFDQFVERYLVDKGTTLVDLAGNNPTLAIKETQTQMMGWFEFEEGPEKGDKQSENSAHNITFSYKLKLDKPIASVMNYPLMIHNQLIDKKFRPTEKSYEVDDYRLAYSNSVGALRTFAPYEQSRKFKPPGIAIPVFDDFIPASTSIPLDTMRVLTALTSVDLSNPKVLLDLKDLGTFTIDPVIQAFMVVERNWIQKLGTSVLNLVVYENDVAMHSTKYSMDENLIVNLVDDPDPRKIYHVRLAVYMRPRLLTDDAKQRMRENGEATNKILEALRRTLDEEGYLPPVIVNPSFPNGYIPKTELNKTLEYLDGFYDTKYTGQIYQWNTVETLIIDTSVNYHAPRPTK